MEHLDNIVQPLLAVNKDGSYNYEIIDRDSFLGKMQFFFPSFFNKISSDELTYLKNNESWVLEIFGYFWDLLLKNLDDSGILP
jgi:hypothetical protein